MHQIICDKRKKNYNEDMYVLSTSNTLVLTNIIYEDSDTITFVTEISIQTSHSTKISLAHCKTTQHQKSKEKLEEKQIVIWYLLNIL